MGKAHSFVHTCLLAVQKQKHLPEGQEPVEQDGEREAAAVQAAVELVQKRMRQFDGSFLQFRCDEKGFLSICAFGLPGKTHEDGPARAIQVTLIF